MIPWCPRHGERGGEKRGCETSRRDAASTANMAPGRRGSPARRLGSAVSARRRTLHAGGMQPASAKKQSSGCGTLRWTYGWRKTRIECDAAGDAHGLLVAIQHRGRPTEVGGSNGVRHIGPGELPPSPAPRPKHWPEPGHTGGAGRGMGSEPAGNDTMRPRAEAEANVALRDTVAKVGATNHGERRVSGKHDDVSASREGGHVSGTVHAMFPPFVRGPY